MKILVAILCIILSAGMMSGTAFLLFETGMVDWYMDLPFYWELPISVFGLLIVVFTPIFFPIYIFCEFLDKLNE